MESPILLHNHPHNKHSINQNFTFIRDIKIYNIFFYGNILQNSVILYKNPSKNTPNRRKLDIMKQAKFNIINGSLVDEVTQEVSAQTKA